MDMARVEQIRRANASWCPRPEQNPAGFHCKNDIAFLLSVIDTLNAQAGCDCDFGCDKCNPEGL